MAGLISVCIASAPTVALIASELCRARRRRREVR